MSTLDARLKEKNETAPVSNQTNWHAFNGYNESSSDDIEDVAGASADRNISSVPSPLARMHLVDTAFKFVDDNRNDATNQSTVYHKLVSDCLDVWEILFTWNQHYGLDFHVWDKTANVADIKKSPSTGHQLLARTLDLYLNKDSNPKIKAISQIYLISHNGVVFAGSSPFTGFFTSPNLANLPLNNSQGKPFFTTPTPLKDRNDKFQVFIWKLIKAYQDSISYFFVNFFNYVYNNLQTSPYYASKLNPIWLATYQPASFVNEYSHLVQNSIGQVLQLNFQNGITNHLLFSLPVDTLKVDTTCQFLIRPTKQSADAAEKYPLVLQSGATGIYLDGKPFLSDTKVPIDVVDENGEVIPLDERRLPVYNIKHPFLAAGDFIEEYLVKLPYPINDAAFIIGNSVGFNDANPFCFLLPIKPLYFEYFTFSDLKRNLRITRKEFTIRVELNIPINRPAQPFITLSRDFQKTPGIFPTHQQIRGNKASSNGTANMGYIVEEDFGLMLFPFLKMRPVRLDQSSPYNDFYKLGVVTRPDNEHEVNVEFYRIPSSALPVPLPEANRPVDNQVTQRSRNSKYHILNQEFDFIQIKINGIVTYAATIMPDWSLASKDLGNLSFDVAIDFGTSNTYVAYRQAGANAVSFDIKETEIQLVRLDKPVQSRSGGGITKKYENLEMGSLILGVLTRIQRDEVTPSVMGIEASGYNMPFQTAVAEAGYITNAQQINLANSNIPFAFGKHYQSTDVKIHTGIKWNNPKPATFDEKRINVFFETLLYMIRTKILLNGGNPAQSRLIWFKPLSMSNFQIQNLSRQWSSLYRRIFDSITAPICITESEAPYYIHSATGRFGGNEPVLSMDIGGGTTDVLLFYNDQPLYSTSSLMASRVLFGEFRNRTFQKNNPILKYYRPMIKELIEAFISNGQTDDLKDAGGQMKSLHEWYFNSSSTTRSEDVISFYFSRPELQFADHLRNEKSPFKVVFLFYLGALHYHYAHYIRYLNLPAPRHICMSGNGSRILNLIDPVPDANNSPVSRFITEIYKKAFTNGINFTIKVHTTPQPKEATAQGGLWKEQKQINQEAQAKILVGEKLYDVYNNMVTDEQVINNLTYQNFQDGPQKLSFKAQNSNYYEFVDFFLGELNKRINYKANFGVIVNLDDLYPILKDDSLVEADFNAGMFNRLELADVQDTLYETVFFYPVMGAISRLSEYLAEKYPDNK